MLQSILTGDGHPFNIKETTYKRIIKLIMIYKILVLDYKKIILYNENVEMNIKNYKKNKKNYS